MQLGRDLRSHSNYRQVHVDIGDAASLPILPGLVTDEVLSGDNTRSATAPRRVPVGASRRLVADRRSMPRMGERFRLKASFDITSYPADVQVILRAMPAYGICWPVAGRRGKSQVNRTRAGTTITCTPSDSCSGRTSRPSMRRCCASIRIRARHPNGVTVAVSPLSAAVRTGRSKAFTATVTGAPNTVTWSVNGTAGGDTVVGTVDGNGQYLAPTAVPNPATVTLRAVSTSSPTSTASAAITIRPLPAVSSVSPSPVAAGTFTHRKRRRFHRRVGGVV